LAIGFASVYVIYQLSYQAISALTLTARLNSLTDAIVCMLVS
jgi:hypothetical protein